MSVFPKGRNFLYLKNWPRASKWYTFYSFFCLSVLPESIRGGGRPHTPPPLATPLGSPHITTIGSFPHNDWITTQQLDHFLTIIESPHNHWIISTQWLDHPTIKDHFHTWLDHFHTMIGSPHNHWTISTMIESPHNHWMISTQWLDQKGLLG